jgi:hypothetical protein
MEDKQFVPMRIPAWRPGSAPLWAVAERVLIQNHSSLDKRGNSEYKPPMPQRRAADSERG